MRITWGPDIGDVITIADRREGDHDEVTRLEQVEMAVTSPLEMLDTAYTKSNGLKSMSLFSFQWSRISVEIFLTKTNE